MDGVAGGLLARLSGMRRWIALALVGLVSPLLISCYGQFPLTRYVYRINGAVPTGILRNVVFWVFVIVPVYETAMVGDAVVLNLIEYWLGAKLPVACEETEDGTKVVLEAGSGEGEALLTLSRDGAVVSRVRFLRVSDRLCEVRDAEGVLLGKVVLSEGGSLRLTDRSGGIVAAIPAEQLACLQGRKAGIAAAPPSAGRSR